MIIIDLKRKENFFENINGECACCVNKGFFVSITDA